MNQGFRRLVLRQGWDTTSVADTGYAGSEAPEADRQKSIIQWIRRTGTGLEGTPEDATELASATSSDEHGPSETTTTQDKRAADYHDGTPSPPAINLISGTARTTPTLGAANKIYSLQAANKKFTMGGVGTTPRMAGVDMTPMMGPATATSAPVVPMNSHVTAASTNPPGERHEISTQVHRSTPIRPPPVPPQRHMKVTPAEAEEKYEAQMYSGHRVWRPQEGGPFVDKHDPSGVGGTLPDLIVRADVGSECKFYPTQEGVLLTDETLPLHTL